MILRIATVVSQDYAFVRGRFLAFSILLGYPKR
jgi:hypothetical protein